MVIFQAPYQQSQSMQKLFFKGRQTKNTSAYHFQLQQIDSLPRFPEFRSLIMANQAPAANRARRLIDLSSNYTKRGSRDRNYDSDTGIVWKTAFKNCVTGWNVKSIYIRV